MADARKYGLSGHPYYNPDNIKVPTLIIGGEWDKDTPPARGQAIFALMTHTPMKRYVMLGEGTHMMAYETTRLALFTAVQQFLDERP